MSPDATGPADPARELLIDSFRRIRDLVDDVAGEPPEVLAFHPAPGANTIAWLVWHLTRVQDSHVAHLAGTEPVWSAAGWVDRFDLDLAPGATGYGASADEVAALDGAPGDLLLGYHADVHAATAAYLERVDAAELARVVDTNWDPPVTASARLVSIIGDCLQHVGQAAYVRGLAEG
ncbi:MAG TPA: DUF664 domain-containing protein [Acidimicrobiales bacterium]|nr:DUF664 domain-containing protein [Acidimicrobiales bacterium]